MEKALNFCENCNELTSKIVCPKCDRATRKPQPRDLCFVGELGNMGKSMFTDALSNNEIEFVDVPVHGGFSRLNTPTGYKVYVHYADYYKALETLDVLFGVQDGVCEENFDNPKSVIDRVVKVVIDRPLGSLHPEHPDIKYELNYGYVQGVTGGDGEEQDAYIMGVNSPLSVGSQVDGYVIAVIRRKNDVETKWVVVPYYARAYAKGPYTKDEIAQAVRFQEKFFDTEIIM